ncbi:MAG TPA: anthranilate synthase component I family protein, partial [Longimicrobiaceae bacterium]|nr:anthranilate synthase component I family protein [Longimicrobiaceae bacterium]
MADPVVRLDSFDPARGARSFRFGGPRRVLRADRLDEVVPLLVEVERAAADGLHAVGFVAYEAAPAFDPALAAHPPDPRLPLAWFALYAEREESSPEWDDTSGDATLGAWETDTPFAGYRERVERIREWIAAGDTYQVNFTVRLRAPFAGSEAALYRRLCLAQRSACCAFLRFGGTAVLSASPELFFRWSGGELELRPMKGTRPRGRWPEEDERLAAELTASAKERAENLMIVDLLRSDAGRVATFGSVRVERLFEVERYETVHQLTSTIRARTPPETRLADVFRALFPCGSVTGAPKVHTSELITRVE